MISAENLGMGAIAPVAVQTLVFSTSHL